MSEKKTIEQLAEEYKHSLSSKNSIIYDAFISGAAKQKELLENESKLCTECGYSWITGDKADEMMKEEFFIRHKEELRKAVNRNADLAEKIKDYEQALEVYSMTNETFPEYGDVAREVLKKWGAL